MQKKWENPMLSILSYFFLNVCGDKKFWNFFLKTPSERIGPQASFLCWTRFSTVSHKRLWGEPINQLRFLVMDPPCLACLSTWGQYIKNSFSEPHAKVSQPLPNLSNKQFTKRFIFQNYWSCPQAYHGRGPRKKCR